MATQDVNTGQWLKELREARGLSPEEVPYAMAKAGVDRRTIPSARTIRRIEDTAIRPQVRHRFAFAQFYDIPVGHLWPIEWKGSNV